MYKAQRPALNRKAPRHTSCRDGQSVSFRKVGKQIPGVAEFDFPKRQTPRHPIQIPISVPRTRHTRITAIWLGHARPLFQLRNPRLSHLWCLHSWKSLLEKSVQWCLTGHVLSILANWKAVFATHLEALHKVQLCCMHFVSLKMCLLFTPSTSIISQNVTQKQLSQSSCNSTLIQTCSRDSLDQFQWCVRSSDLNVQHPFLHELHMSCFIKRHQIISNHHISKPRSWSQGIRKELPCSQASSFQLFLREISQIRSMYFCQGSLDESSWLTSCDELLFWETWDKRDYERVQRWTKKNKDEQIQRIVVWFNSFSKISKSTTWSYPPFVLNKRRFLLISQYFQTSFGSHAMPARTSSSVVKISSSSAVKLNLRSLQAETPHGVMHWMHWMHCSQKSRSKRFKKLRKWFNSR